MKAKITTLLFILTFFNSYVPAQALTKKWDKRLGGTNQDALSQVIQTKDGGYILAGVSNSGVGGDKSQPNWDTTDYTMDYWIIKVDANGNKEWDKRFGGTWEDELNSIAETLDGGYILGGSSSSGIGGDKTQADWDTINGTRDYWIVKVDSLGNKQWDKTFGGLNEDLLISIQQTKDRGYILGGRSKSGIGGDKTQGNWDNTQATDDYWIVKIDSLGNKQWDKRFGGTDIDELYSISQTKDNGYIIGGSSNSAVSGDKTQANWDTTLVTDDYWIMKIDSIGNTQWDKRFGGAAEDAFSSLQLSADGGYILGGSSYSGISGDKTQAEWGSGYYNFDYWIVKIDSFGNKEWDMRYGGVSTDFLYSINQTSDSGYLLSGVSESPEGGNKSENNLGIEQGWMVKIDASGKKQWDKTIFTTDTLFEVNAYAIQTNEGCYAIAEMSTAGIGGYKTQPNWDYTNSTSDFWIVQFCDSVTTGTEIIALSNNTQILVSPNPFTSDIAIAIQTNATGKADFAIYNTLGQQIYTKQETNLSGSYTKMLDLSHLPNGVYFVEMLVDGEKVVKEIVKE